MGLFFIIFSYHFVANPTCDPPSCFFILQIKSAYSSDPDYEKSHLDNKSEVSINKYRSLRQRVVWSDLSTLYKMLYTGKHKGLVPDFHWIVLNRLFRSRPHYYLFVVKIITFIYKFVNHSKRFFKN